MIRRRGRGWWIGAVGLPAACGVAGASCPRVIHEISGVHSFDDFGRSVAWVGDVDGDGGPDFAVGSPRENGAAPGAGVVRVYSGRDGTLISASAGSMIGELYGWSVAGVGDVNGDGVPDLAVGAPRSDAHLAPANLQAAKLRPAIEAMAGSRVDFVCAAGDSNHFSLQYGYNAGLQVALSRQFPCYATEVHSPNENNGRVLGRWGSLVINATGGPFGSMSGAPATFDAAWDVDAVSDVLQPLHRYAFFDAGQRMTPSMVHGLNIRDYHPIGLQNRLRFSISYGAFASGASSFTPEVRQSVFPYTPYGVFEAVSTGPAAQDEIRRVEFELPADPTRGGDMLMRWVAPGTPDLQGPAFLLWMRAQNPDQASGYAFSNIWAVGGRSARDAVDFYSLTPVESLASFFEEVRRGQGADKKVVIYIEEGGNDRIDHRESIRGHGPSSEPAGFRDNIEFIRDRIREAWALRGWPEDELYFVLLGYHVLSDDPARFGEDRLRLLRQVARDLAEEWPRTTCIDLPRMTSETEGKTLGWYADENHAHLTPLGYTEVSRRIVNALTAPPATPGRVVIVSGADGSVIREWIGPAAGDRFGWSLASPGDLDGDGAGELVIGAPGGAGAPGSVAIYNPATGALVRRIDEPAGPSSTSFGFVVAAAGDVNADATPDVLVGAPAAEFGTGAALIYSGADGSLLRRLDGAGTDRFGSAVAGVGDADGDGVHDVAVGAPDADGDQPVAGIVQLFSGATGDVLWTWRGQETSEGFGETLAAVGDLDGDGLGDLAIGAPRRSAARPEAGAVVIVSGRGGSTLETYDGELRYGHLGASMAGAQDANGDGRGDLLLAATAGTGSGYGIGSDAIGAAGVAVVLSGELSCCFVDLIADGTVDFSDYLEFLNIFEIGQLSIDFNEDGLVDFSDYLDFLSRFDELDPAVDLNGDAVVDFQDYLVFLNRLGEEPRVRQIDFNQDGQISFSDYLEFLNLYDGCGS